MSRRLSYLFGLLPLFLFSLLLSGGCAGNGTDVFSGATLSGDYAHSSLLSETPSAAFSPIPSSKDILSPASGFTPAPDASEAPSDDPENAFRKAARENLSYYCDIALKSEFGDSDGKIHKWEDKIRLYVHPSADAEKYSGFIMEHIEVLNAIPGFPGIEITGTEEEASAELSFVDSGEMRKRSGDAAGSPPCGLVFLSWYGSDCRIFSGEIFILNEAESAPEDVRHSIVEELTQLTGLLNDSYARPDSIFFQGQSRQDSLADIDILLVRMHYIVEFSCGMSYDEVCDAAERIFG